MLLQPKQTGGMFPDSGDGASLTTQVAAAHSRVFNKALASFSSALKCKSFHSARLSSSPAECTTKTCCFTRPKFI